MLPNGWNEWSKYVLKELERLNGCYEKLEDHIQKVSTDIAMLKVKAGVWGLIAGMIPAAVALTILLTR